MTWSERAPGLVRGLLTEWGLTPSGPVRHSESSLVAPVESDGTAALLLVRRPDPERAGEVAALQGWGGRGAARLLTADPRRWALLVERVDGPDLSGLAPVAACAVVAELTATLHRPASPVVPALVPYVAARLDDIARLGRDAPLPSRFAEQALAAGRALLEGEERALLHGDLRYTHVLAAQREPWLAIAPLGFAGDPCFEIAPLLWHRWRDYGSDLSAGILERFWAVVDATGWSERRARDWVVVRSVASIARTVAAAAGQPLDEPTRDWVTCMVITCKAMQSV